MLVKPIKEFLKSGEKIIFEDKLHPIELVFSIIWSVLFAIIGIVMIISATEPEVMYGGYALLVITLISFILSLIKYFTTVIVITNSRVFKKYGLIGNYTSGNQLTKIEAVEMNQGIFDRIFNTFSVKVNGVGGDESKTFGSLENAQEFYTTLQAATDKTMSEINDKNVNNLNVENLKTTDMLRQAGQLLIDVANSLDNQK